jgi:hypothetical protein
MNQHLGMMRWEAFVAYYNVSHNMPRGADPNENPSVNNGQSVCQLVCLDYSCCTAKLTGWLAGCGGDRGHGCGLKWCVTVTRA